MRECLLLYVYKNNREFNMGVLKDVYEDSIVFSTDRILVMDLLKIKLDDIFPAVSDFNTGQFMVVNYRLLDIISFSVRNKYKILGIEFYNDIKEESRKLICEILDFINSETVNPIIKGRLLGLLKEEVNYEEFENDNGIKSIKIKLESSDIEFCNCTKIRFDDNISESDIVILKDILDSISD